eukprot:Amastigsp_a848049_15.p1 type:complete len:453 gc:universal Amastigsp_a848049_15:1381-23(-)
MAAAAPKRQFVQADGTLRKICGYKRSRFEPESVNRFETKVGKLPPRVDLRPFMSAVEDQGELSSCTANAVAGACEYLIRKQFKRDEDFDVSRLFVYYNARALEDEDADEPDVADEGSCINLAIEGLKRFGVCSEAAWPYDEENVNERPSDEAYAEAKDAVRVSGARLVPTNLDAWRTALACGSPIVFGINTFESFDDFKPNKPVIPVPRPDEAARESHAGHAMLCVGYSDVDQVFIIRNSWSESWGKDGYAYLPYAYCMNEQLNDGDSWCVEGIATFEPDETAWAYGDESIIEDVSEFLAGQTDEEWRALKKKMGAVSLEMRLAVLFMAAARADGDIDGSELEQAIEHLTPVLKQLGSSVQASKLAKNARAHLRNKALINETIALFGEAFDASVLASIARQIQDIVGADDDVADGEERFVNRLVSQWQIDPALMEDDGEDEGEGEDEGDGNE